MLKSVERSAAIAFCQNGPFLAAGSVAGAIDLNFSTSSNLEIFSLDLSNTSTDLPLAGGAVHAPERFSRLCWGPPGLDAKLYPHGLIGGGLADGSICIWNPARIIGHGAQEGGKGAMLCRLQKHQGAVKGLEFNPFSPNLLASGGVDGDLCIWDVGSPAQPSLYPAMKGGASGSPQPEITYLAWNRKVQHILATCTGAGTVVVWDLKKQRPVISFKDPSGRKRCSVVQWNPDVATQLMVASDDDQSPSLQLWDLRNSVSPLKEFHGHSKGVLGMSWCPQDASFVLSTAKDNRTVCWDVSSTEVYCELPITNNWNFDVQWAPGQLAGIFATATFEGQLAVSSLAACSAPSADADGGFGSITAASGVAKSKAPAWLKRPTSTAFGFGGKLMQVTNTKRQLPTGEVAEAGTVTISQVTAEPELVIQSEAFEVAIRGGEREQLRSFCEAKEAALAGTEEAETWAFLQTHFEGDGRRYLLQRLGFEDVLPPVEEPPAEEAAPGVEGAEGLAEGMDALGLDASAQQAQQEAAAAAAVQLAGDGADFFDEQPESFFDDLAANTPPNMSPHDVPAGSGAKTPPQQTPRASKEQAVIDGPAGEGEHEIQRALFVGNYQGAVDACIKANRHADALIVASLVGGDTWDRARREFMFAHPHPYMRVVHAMLGADWGGFIKARPPSAWRETLAAILTSAPYDQFEGLVAQLAHRLTTAGMHHAATLCFVTSGDVDAAVREWAKAASGPKASVEALEALMEKAVVLGLGVSKQSASDALSGLIVRYAELLAANGRLGMALEYLDMVPGEASTSVAILKDRIYRGGGAAQATHPVMQPPFPFVAEQVQEAPMQQPLAAAAASYGAYGGGAQAGGGGYGGYGAQPTAANGYATAATYGSYGTQQQPAAQTYPTYGGGYGAAPAAPQPTYQAPAAPQPTYQAPAAPRSVGRGYSAPPPVYQPAAAAPAPPAATYSQQQQQQPPAPAVFAPAAAAAAPPQPAVYQPPPAAAAPPPPQVFQPAAGPASAALPSPKQAAPTVYQQPPAPAVAAPTVYQQPPAAAGPPSAGAPFGAQRSGSLPGPSPTFVPQQGPSPTAVAAAAAAAFGQQQAPAAPPAAPKPQPPPPPAGPPANVTITNVDTSKVGPELRPIVNSLVALHQACEAGAGANPAKRRELEDSSRKIGALLWRLNAGEASQSVTSKLLQVGGKAGPPATAAGGAAGSGTSAGTGAADLGSGGGADAACVCTGGVRACSPEVGCPRVSGPGLSRSVTDKLLQLCAALDAGDYAMATHVQVALTTSDWDEASSWLTALKRLIKTRQMLG